MTISTIRTDEITVVGEDEAKEGWQFGFCAVKSQDLAVGDIGSILSPGRPRALASPHFTSVLVIISRAS